MEITMKGISKAFGSNEVLKGVDLTLKSGEIHALMGENGAGKSTLMNILTGIHKADSGTICVDGREISFKNALEAEKCGIAFIHQELNIWPNLSILENLFLMQNVTNSFGMLDFKKMRRLAEEKCSQMGITLPFDAEAGECSVGQQQTHPRNQYGTGSPRHGRPFYYRILPRTHKRTRRNSPGSQKLLSRRTVQQYLLQTA